MWFKTDVEIEHDLTLWIADDVPPRMFYGGRRWQVTDTPTRLRDSIWALSAKVPRGLWVAVSGH